MLRIVSSLALLFILKIRLQSINNILTYTARRYGEEGKQLYRRYEATRKKHTKSCLDLEFLVKCKTYRTVPKFLRFKLYKRNLHSSSFYKSWQNKLLIHEINFKKKSIEQLLSQTTELKDLISAKFSRIDSMIVFHCVNEFVYKFRERIASTHAKKLKDLGVNNKLSPVDPQSVVYNFSSLSLSKRVITLLAFGLDFGLPIYKIDYFQYFLKFESLFSRLGKLECTQNDLNELKSKLHFLSYKYFYNFKPYKIFSCIFNREDISLLKSLSRNKDIIISKPDKGRGVVIIDRVVYVEKMKEFLSNTSKFQVIHEPIDKFTRKIEDKLNNFIRKIKGTVNIPASTLNDLSSSGGAPGILYGLPKIHKLDFKDKFQFRPIFAAYNNPCFKLARFIVSVITPYVNNEFSVLNSSSFVSELQQFNHSDGNLFMTSYDIENLYTNIPLAETVEIVLNKLFTSSATTFLGLSRKLFRSLLEIGTMNSFFVFDNILYKQCDGLGMGLPQSPAFANIFLAHHEQSWIGNCPSDFKPVFYRRYVDDTFVLFKDKSHAPLFLDYLNRQHANINFTMETEENNSLAFLDVNVKRNDNKFDTSVFRKSTFSGLGISFFSFCPSRFKINSITTLLHRAFNVCSSYQHLHEEFEFLCNFFCNNGFPVSLIRSKINHFLNSKYDKTMDGSPQQIQTFYLSLPYFGFQSEKLKSELTSLLDKYFNNVKFNIILVNKHTVGGLFRYKDTLDKGMSSAVVYKFCCPKCRAHYIGSTCRRLSTRAAEHAGVSVRTGVPLSSPSPSHIREHMHACGGPQVSISNFNIIGRCSNVTDLRILESLHINRSKPNINSTQSAYPLSIVNL